MKDSELTLEFNKGIRELVRDALRISIRKPALAWFLWRTAWRQRAAGQRRLAWEKRGVHVPPFMIVSVTSRCNLNCKGCYSQAQHRSAEGEMSTELLRRVLGEARELGVSIILLAGGEPLVRQDILAVTGDFPDILFPMFTNGLLIDDQMSERLHRQKNIIPVISLEGYENQTDDRRGEGVHRHLQGIIDRLKGQSIFLGTSLTVTRQNYETITGDEFIGKLVASGCKIVFFIEYIPVREGTEDWVPTRDQRERLVRTLDTMRSTHPGLFIAFPGDEEAMGGCLSSGRGFVHISSQGDLEPCPFAPYSDTSLKNMPLREALRSRFLRTIRDNHDKLRETEGGCALWQEREWVQSMLREASGS